jgi:hypothetical protein
VVPWLNWIEQPPPKGQVTGSSPVGITIFPFIFNVSSRSLRLIGVQNFPKSRAKYVRCCQQGGKSIPSCRYVMHVPDHCQ